MDSDANSGNTGLIVVIVGASVVVLALIVSLIYCYCWRGSQSTEQAGSSALELKQQESNGEMPLLSMGLVDRFRGKGWQNHRLVREAKTRREWV